MSLTQKLCHRMYNNINFMSKDFIKFIAITIIVPATGDGAAC